MPREEVKLVVNLEIWMDLRIGGIRISVGLVELYNGSGRSTWYEFVMENTVQYKYAIAVAMQLFHTIWVICQQP